MKNKNAIGSYPIDEYVAGVILGESVARMYYEGYYEGKTIMDKLLLMKKCLHQ